MLLDEMNALLQLTPNLKSLPLDDVRNWCVEHRNFIKDLLSQLYTNDLKEFLVTLMSRYALQGSGTTESGSVSRDEV
jgi:hypothetical protein